MITIKDGHIYALRNLDGTGEQTLRFVNRGHNEDEKGTTNQEVLRALINRIEFLDNELSWESNKRILKHLRIALVLHESRHLERAVELDKIKPENIKTGKDGHFILQELNNDN